MTKYLHQSNALFSKPTEFLAKFKDRLSKTGREGITPILVEGTINQINNDIKEKATSQKNLRNWKEAYEEAGSGASKVNKYPDSIILFKKVNLTNSESDQGFRNAPGFNSQIEKSINLKNRNIISENYYRNGWTPYTIDDYKIKNFDKSVTLRRGLGSNVGSENWELKQSARLKLVSYSSSIKLKKSDQPKPKQTGMKTLDNDSLNLKKQSLTVKLPKIKIKVTPHKVFSKKRVDFNDFMSAESSQKTSSRKSPNDHQFPEVQSDSPSNFKVSRFVNMIDKLKNTMIN